MNYRFPLLAIMCTLLVVVACSDSTSTDIAPMARYTLEHDGLEREYFVFLPSGYEDGGQFPVVLFMHGYGGTATGAEAETTNGLARYAEEYGYVLVFPQSTWFASEGGSDERREVTSWNHISDGFDKGPDGPICTADVVPYPCPPECGSCGECGWASCHDDVGFLKALVAKISAEFVVDSNRVYVSGFSNGAMMANRIACEASELFAAVALVGGRVEPGFECMPTRALPLLQVNGEADEVIPHDGRASHEGYFYASTDAIAEQWNNGADCVADKTGWSTPTIADESVQCTIACADSERESIDCLWPEGTHRWPGTPGTRGSGGYCVTELQAASLPGKARCADPDRDQEVWGSQLMFEFFDRHRREAGNTHSVGQSIEYEWFSQGTPAGKSTVVRTGDGRISTESFLHWNNREYTVSSETQLDSNGLVVAQRITGISPFGAPIDESFSYEDGVARWSTVGNSGSVTTDTPGFYVATEYGALGIAALVRAAIANIDGEIALLPSGTARVEKMTAVDVMSSDGTKPLTLYAISGLDFTPLYAWFDDELELKVLDFGGYMGMLPKGWDLEELDKLSAIQTKQDGLMIEKISGGLATELDRALVFDNVDVIDVENGVVLEDHHVHVANGKIKAVSANGINVHGALRVDGTGKSLMPGLWDMHGHFGLSDGVLNIAGGITSVRDIGSVHEQIMELTAKHDAGDVIGPNTYRSGFIDQASPYATGKTVTSLEEALERVDFFAEHGYMQIKLYSSIDPSWVDDIAERTHAHGMRLSGHIPAFMSAEQAVKAGYDEIQHINMVFLNFLAGDREDTRKQLRFTLYGDEAGDLDLDSKEVSDFIELLIENDVVIDPTAAIFDTMLVHRPGDPDPTFASVAAHLPATVARNLYKPEMDMGEEKVATWAKSAVNQAAMLKKLHDSGVQLVPGSDHIAAFTIHRELEVYAEAGISNADVLKIATLDSARIVGVDDRTGSISVGKDSDLVLLDGNPLEDISAVRRATLVVKGNTIYRPDDLYKVVGVKPFVESAAL